MPPAPDSERLGGPPWPAQLAARLAQPSPHGVTATAATAAVWTILAASQLAWRAGDHAPGLVRMGALDLHSLDLTGYWPILTAAWLHPGLGSTLAGVAALAWAQPLETALGRPRWLLVLLGGGLAGAALAAGGSAWPGVGAPAAAAAVMAGRVALWGRAGMPLGSWAKMSGPLGFSALLSVLAATQWLQVSSVAAVFLGAAVGAVAVLSPAVTWGAFQDPRRSALGNAKTLWLSKWTQRWLTTAVLLASLVTLLSQWSRTPPWHAGAPRGWLVAQPCPDAPAFEVPAGLGPTSCVRKGANRIGHIGDARRDLLTVSAVAAPQDASVTNASIEDQEHFLRTHLTSTTPLGLEVAGVSRLPLPGAVALLQQQTSQQAWLPRVAMLRCGQLLDVQVSVIRGAPGRWHEAAARVAASFGARCPPAN